MKLTAQFVVVALLASLFAPPAHAVWQNGQWINTNPYLYFGKGSIYRRPFAATEKSVNIADWRIADMPLDAKGIEIGATKHADGTAWAYRTIGISHCEISDAWRNPGIHNDFIRIFGGGGNKQDVPTTVVLSDIYIHDGNAMPIIVQDGEFDKIILRHIRVENVTNSPQLVTINSGSIGEVHIENCPGLKVTVCGRPGSVTIAYIRNSPGATVFDAMTAKGRSGVKIIDEGTVAVAPAPEPAPAPVPPPAVPPSQPLKPVAKAISSTRVSLQWVDCSGETGYVIQRSLYMNSGWRDIATLAADRTTYTDTNLRPRTTYYYKLRAINQYGYKQSNTAGVTTPK